MSLLFMDGTPVPPRKLTRVDSRVELEAVAFDTHLHLLEDGIDRDFDIIRRNKRIAEVIQELEIEDGTYFNERHLLFVRHTTDPVDLPPRLLVREGPSQHYIDVDPETCGLLYSFLNELRPEALDVGFFDVVEGLHPFRGDLLRWVSTRDPAVIEKVLQFVVGKMRAPEGWAWRPGEVPRRKWNEPFSGLYPAGVSADWRSKYVRRVFGLRNRAFSLSVPPSLITQSLPDSVRGKLLRQVLLLQNTRDDGPGERRAQRYLDGCFNIGSGGFKKPPGACLPIPEQNGDRLVHELLNGMAPAHLRTTDEPNLFEAHYTFTDLPFGDPGRGPDSLYRLPDTVVTVEIVENDGKTLAEIRSIAFRYRKRDGDYTAGGIQQYRDAVVVGMSQGVAPEWKQSAARRILMGIILLAGQIDGHIAMGHLAMEAMAVCFNKVRWDPDHPVYQALCHRLAEVDAVNRNADDNVWGRNGLFPTVTALTQEALSTRKLERARAIDWKGWRPRSKSIADNHYAPVVISTYFKEVVTPYVDDLFNLNENGQGNWFEVDSTHRRQMLEFFRHIDGMKLKHAPWDDVSDPAVWQDSSEFTFKSAGSKAYSSGSTSQDVKDLLKFILHNTTMGHSWPNVRQWQTAGDPAFGSPSLKLDIDEAPQDASWHDEAAPNATDALFLMLITDVLTYLDVDNLGDEWRVENSGNDAAGLGGWNGHRHPHDPLSGAHDGNGNPRSLAGRYNTIRGKLETLVGGRYNDELVHDAGRQLSRCNR